MKEDTTAQGMEGLLGDLEQAVMDVVWRHGEISVRDVQAALSDRNPAYTTVMTVMARLAEKGVLERRRLGRAFVYRPAHAGRQGFLKQQARAGVRSLLEQFGDLALAEFVDELAATPEQIEALEDLLAEHHEDEEG